MLRPHAIDSAPEKTLARRWLIIAVGSLLLAGILSLMLVIGRLPPLDRLITDPHFFRRCLVVHVDLALVVWFYAFVAALMALLPGRGESSLLSRVSFVAGGAGVLLLVGSAAAPAASPILSNYIPMIDTPAFSWGLVLFAVGVLASFLDGRMLPGSSSSGQVLPVYECVAPGLRTTGIALIVAALTFMTSWTVRPDGLAPEVLYELANWGGGHVLQVASTSAMLSVWLWLLSSLAKTTIVSRRASVVLFGSLLLPWMVSPLLAARGIQDVDAREWFTRLMQWGLFPVVLVTLVVSVRSLLRLRPDLRTWIRDPKWIGFVASASLSIVGFILGAMIRGSNTMVPAHYHAAIGAVTAAFMTMAYPLMSALGGSVRSPRLRALSNLQPALFGVGQALFAVGFAWAGAYGMGRKLYGAEQHARGVGEILGLLTMGLGGLIAILGGLFFLAFAVASLRSASLWHGRHNSDVDGTWRIYGASK